MTVTDGGLILTILVTLFILTRLGRKTVLVSVSNKVALGLLFVFVGYAIFSQEVKKFVLESQSSPNIYEIEKDSIIDQNPKKTISTTTKEQFVNTPEKEESTIKNKRQQEMIEDFERKRSEIYERHERFKKNAQRKLDEISKDP